MLKSKMLNTSHNYTCNTWQQETKDKDANVFNQNGDKQHISMTIRTNQVKNYHQKDDKKMIKWIVILINIKLTWRISYFLKYLCLNWTFK